MVYIPSIAISKHGNHQNIIKFNPLLVSVKKLACKVTTLNKVANHCWLGNGIEIAPIEACSLTFRTPKR